MDNGACSYRRFLEGDEKHAVAKEALTPLAWVTVHILNALRDTENNPVYTEKASRILDILFEGEEQSEFVKNIRNNLSR